MVDQSSKAESYKGKQVRDQIHSTDVISAFDAFITASRCGEVHNLGGGRDCNISVLEAIDAVEGLTGRRLDRTYIDEPRRGDHICYISDVLEHLDNLAGFCRGARRYLRPGGRLIIATPNPWWWVRFVQAAMGRVHVNPEHTIWLSPGTAAELLGRFGFVVDDVTWGSDEAWLYCVPAPGLTRHTSFYLSAHAVRDLA